MLSAYEQERLDNIAKNQAFLDAIGLGNDKPDLIPKKKNKRCRDDTDDDDGGPTEPTRKSARVAKLDPEHGQGTHTKLVWRGPAPHSSHSLGPSIPENREKSLKFEPIITKPAL